MSKKSDKFLPTPSASMMTEQDFAQAKFHSKTRPKYRDAGFSTLLPTPRSSPNENRQTKRTPSQEQSQHGLCLSAEIASCSPPDSPASPSPVQGEERARQTTATSGHRLLQLLRLSDPIGCCLRMLLESSIWYSPTVRLQWQTKPLFAKYRMTKSQIMTPSQEELTETSEKQGMRLFGLLYQLAVSGHPTDETGCGLLPTVESWDYKGEKPENPYDCLDSLIETGATKDQVGKKTGMKLQPAFVEWMMGFPIGWTDLNPSETP